MKTALQTTVLTLPEHQNRGAAVLAAAKLAWERGDDAIIVTTSSDNLAPADYQRLIAAALTNWPAIVLAVQQPTPPTKGSARRISDFLIRLESGQKSSEAALCCRLYPLQLLVSQRFLCHGAGFATEALVRGSWAGLPLLPVPIHSVQNCPQSDSPSTGEWLLHCWLLLRSLLPWPHRRIIPRPALGTELIELLHPLRFFKNLSKEHTSAGQLAAAVWVGIFIGALPIIPFGIATIIYVNHKLHLNKLAGVGASNICIAPFVPLLCIEVGHFFRYGRFWYEFNRQTLLFEIHHRLWEWLLGALVIGPLLGLAGALLTFWLVQAFRKKSTPEPVFEDYQS